MTNSTTSYQFHGTLNTATFAVEGNSFRASQFGAGRVELYANTDGLEEFAGYACEARPIVKAAAFRALGI